MAELSLYLTENDEVPIIALAMQLGCKLIPDLGYPTAQHDSLNAVGEYRLYRSRTRLFFLTSERFLRHPLELRRIEKNGDSVFYVADIGGPVIQFLGGGSFEEHGSRFVRPGSIGHHARYLNPANKLMEKPPSELRDTYKELQKLVRKLFRHCKPGKVSFWIGPEAVDAVKNGAKLVGYEKYSVQDLLK